MDIADRAQKDIEFFESQIKHHDEQEAKATGRCLWCDEPVGQGRRWCNSECRDAWEKDNKRGR